MFGSSSVTYKPLKLKSYILAKHRHVKLPTGHCNIVEDMNPCEITQLYASTTMFPEGNKSLVSFFGWGGGDGYFSW